MKHILQIYENYDFLSEDSDEDINKISNISIKNKIVEDLSNKISKDNSDIFEETDDKEELTKADDKGENKDLLIKNEEYLDIENQETDDNFLVGESEKNNNIKNIKDNYDAIFCVVGNMF